VEVRDERARGARGVRTLRATERSGGQPARRPRLRLPWPARRRDSRSGAALAGAAAGESRPTGPTRVLVVDDESSIRMLCRVNLTRAGIEVLEAADGEEALELARAEHPDLVLLDVMMPGLDGWTVAAELAARPETRDIPVVFLTARAESADRRRGHDLGGVGYVVKPFDPIVLAEVVESVLERLERGEREALRSELLRPEE
jgi:CheY-like chemotaxis protein